MPCQQQLSESDTKKNNNNFSMKLISRKESVDFFREINFTKKTYKIIKILQLHESGVIFFASDSIPPSTNVSSWPDSRKKWSWIYTTFA